MKAKILDERYCGCASAPAAPVVAPIRARYKWAFWRRPLMLWGVVQPKREVIGGSVELVWRHIAVFTSKDDADAFLAQIEQQS